MTNPNSNLNTNLNSEKKLTNAVLTEDEPYKNQLYFTISFLTPKQVSPIEHLDIYGFKVLGCHATYVDASEFSSKVEEENPKFDVYIGEVGKIHPWDDQSKVDNVEYKNKKLNDMDRAYRESQGKVKLIKKQMENERNSQIESNNEDGRKLTLMNRLRNKLKEKGIITDNELKDIANTTTPVKTHRKDVAEAIERMNKEMILVKDTDYLEESDPGPYLYGCVTFYSNKNYVNLNQFSFKIRGFSTDYDGIIKRTNKLKTKYPLDTIYVFQVGKWSPYCETDDTPELQLIKLNYGVKMYIDYFEKSKEDYNKRKELLKATANKNNKKLRKAKNLVSDKSNDKPDQSDKPERPDLSDQTDQIQNQDQNSMTIDMPKPIFDNIGTADESTLSKLMEIEKIYEEMKKKQTENA
jgi:hypothetical protein